MSQEKSKLSKVYRLRKWMSELIFVFFVMISSVIFAKQGIEQLVLVDEGQPRAVILISEKPTKSAQLGAFELQEHILLITGVELPICREGEVQTLDAGEIILSIGDTVLAQKHGFKGSDFELRERLVKVTSNSVFMIGLDAEDFGEVVYRRVPPGVVEDSSGLYDVVTWPSYWSESGSLLAVYDFLEQHGGVRWLTPGDDGTYYEPLTTMVVSGGEKMRKSSFRFSRGPHDFLGTTTPWHSNTEGYARYIEATFREAHRVSERETVRRAYRISACRAFLYRKRYGGEWFNANHSFAGFYSRFWEPSSRVPDMFIEKRPEFFGKGYVGRPPQLCLSEKKTLAQFVQDGRDFFNHADTPMLRDYRKRYPDFSNYFSVVPEDNVSWCRCEACRSQLVQQPAASRVNGNASDYVWGFVNAVACELKQSHPDKWVSSLAYWHYSFPPKNIRLEDNIAVQLCMQTRMPYALERQKTDWEMASAWGREYPDMPKYVWAYYCFPEERSNRGPRGQRDWQPSWHVFPGFFARTIASEFRKYRDINVRGIFFNGMGYDVENFVTFAMLEDVDFDVEALLREYFEDMYGPAAEPLRRFYNLVEEVYSNPANYPGDDVVHQTEYLAWGFLGTPARMEVLAEFVAEADRLVAEGSDVQKRRVELFKLNFWDYLLEGRKLYEATTKTHEKREPPNVACPFLLDGSGDGDPLRVNWADTQVLDLWRPVPGQGTTHRVLGDVARDQNYLYVRLREISPSPKLIQGTLPGEGDFWKILWADPEERTLWQLTISPDGSTRTTMCLFNDTPVPYEADARVYTSQGEDGTWTAWISLPLESIPVQRNVIRMQFARGVGRSEDIAMFAPMAAGLTELDHFGIVRLDESFESSVVSSSSDQSIVLKWGFEEEEGTIVSDASDFGNEGRLIGPVLREEGPFGRCLRMRGLRSTQNHVVLDALRGLPEESPFTVSFWVNLDLAIWKLENSSVHHTLLEIPEWLLIRYTIGTAARPSVIAWLHDGGRRNLQTSSRPLTPLEWENFVVTYDGSRLALYLNGRLAAQADDIKFAERTSPTPPLVLGRHSSGAFHRQFRGQLDEVRIDARAWSAEEVLSRYKNGLKAIDSKGVKKDKYKTLSNSKTE